MVSSHAQQQPTTAQVLAAQNQAKMDTDAAKRRAHKPTDKNMPEGIEDLIIGDGVDQFKRLREIERRLDAVMMRKRLDMQDSSQQSFKRYRTLRVWISNTVENQPWQGRSLDENAFDFNTGLEATYKVKIEGRLLDDDEDSDKDSDDEEESEPKNPEKDPDAMDHDGEPNSEPVKPSPERPRHKLSHFFKSITVDFDRGKNFQPETAIQIEWKKPQISPNNPVLPAAADFDSVEFERKSDENLNCTINFYRDETPERFRLSKELADVVDAEEDDKTSVYYGIWEYVKAMGLQQDEEKRRIQCDDRLRKVRIIYPLHEIPQFPQISAPVFINSFASSSNPTSSSSRTSNNSSPPTSPPSLPSHFPTPSALTQPSKPSPPPQSTTSTSPFLPHSPPSNAPSPPHLPHSANSQPWTTILPSWCKQSRTQRRNTRFIRR